MAVMIFLLLILTSVAHAQFDQPEWQIIVPESQTLISGVHAGPINPVIINDLGEVSEFDLQEFLSFVPSGQTSINAIDLNESDFTDPVLLIAFSTAVDSFSMGDVLRCQNQTCNVVFNPYIDLGISEVVQLDALSSKDSLELHVSFNIGFEYMDEHIDPANIYNIVNNGNDVTMNLQTNGSGLGFAETTNLTAFDINRDDEGTSRFFGGSSAFSYNNNEYINTNQLLAFINGPAIFTMPYDFPDSFQQINAFSALNSGHSGFSTINVQVSESAGMVDIGIERLAGAENYMQVVVESADLTAQNGNDYIFSPEVTSWLDADNEINLVSVPIIDNNIIDGNRTFSLHLFPASYFSTVSTTQNVITVTIIDDETGDLIFKDGFE